MPLRRALLVGVVVSSACSRTDRAAVPGPPQMVAPAPADGLDAAFTAHWRAAGVTPVELADDASLLRRVSLDLLGRVPTLAEQSSFATDRSARRYDAAVDRMLASEDHAAHLADQWTDVLLAGAIETPRPIERSTHAWLAARFAEDTPVDAIATAVLTADGEQIAPAPGGFLFAHGRKGRTATVAARTARVFLGTRIECAQCHDHPSEAFTQAEFHGFAAYFARTRVRLRDGDDGRTLVVDERRRGEGRLPLASDAPDRPSGDAVAPRYFGNDDGLGLPDRRTRLAAHIVDDRRFARAIANRTFALLFGRGVVEPVDDLPIHGRVPPLLDALADRLVADGFVIDGLIGALVRSQAYRLASTGEGDGAARVAAFAQADVRPLGGEALLRSLATAADVDQQGELAEVFARRRAALRELDFAFSDDEGTDDDAGNDLPRMLLWDNGELGGLVASARRGTLVDRLLGQADPDARIDLLWRRFYARPPRAAERAEVMTYLAAHTDSDAQPYADLVHALMTSTEFTTNH